MNKIQTILSKIPFAAAIQPVVVLYEKAKRGIVNPVCNTVTNIFSRIKDSIEAKEATLLRAKTDALKSLVYHPAALRYARGTTHPSEGLTRLQEACKERVKVMREMYRLREEISTSHIRHDLWKLYAAIFAVLIKVIVFSTSSKETSKAGWRMFGAISLASGPATLAAIAAGTSSPSLKRVLATVAIFLPTIVDLVSDIFSDYPDFANESTDIVASTLKAVSLVSKQIGSIVAALVAYSLLVLPSHKDDVKFIGRGEFMLSSNDTMFADSVMNKLVLAEIERADNGGYVAPDSMMSDMVGGGVEDPQFDTLNQFESILARSLGWLR